MVAAIATDEALVVPRPSSSGFSAAPTLDCVAPSAGSGSPGVAAQGATCGRGEVVVAVLGPPESIDPAVVHLLYRGTLGDVDGRLHRVWVKFPALQLCWAPKDLPACDGDHVSLLDVAACACREVIGADEERIFRAEVFIRDGLPDASTRRLAVTIASDVPALGDFAAALAQLVASRDREGTAGLTFIQRRLFQYLWLRQQRALTEHEIYDAQAVLTFNLDPKEGVAYMKSKTGKCTDVEVGEWLAQMSTVKGALDPTMLGGYFSRKDTLEVFRAFVSFLDFGGRDIVAALRELFDTFKPGGEGQVITRILEYFAEAYFAQWQSKGDNMDPPTSYRDADTVLQVAVSLIMLNTGLHVVTKKVSKKSAVQAAMTPEEYIENTRRVVSAEEAPDAVLRCWYDAVAAAEISVEPLPRASFSNLPVQPDIEGWLEAVVGVGPPHGRQRLWAVLALQRLYLFSDGSEVEPFEAIDLKETSATSLAGLGGGSPAAARGRGACLCFASRSAMAGASRGAAAELDVAEADADLAFELQQHAGKATMLARTGKARSRLVLLAESADLMERWVHLISAGPM
eukprot:TRINITY_DN12648_c0_g8_i1.p1 TRINITY_DN12648_c0_g8~~TRINITY_DN12648_c0_g8_i1.p1  ORF type:complete len:571 (+),score=133.40 TRINITY_DN12648_c0_g8_i1:146-1858(+)